MFFECSSLLADDYWAIKVTEIHEVNDRPEVLYLVQKIAKISGVELNLISPELLDGSFREDHVSASNYLSLTASEQQNAEEYTNENERMDSRIQRYQEPPVSSARGLLSKDLSQLPLADALLLQDAPLGNQTSREQISLSVLHADSQQNIQQPTTLLIPSARPIVLRKSNHEMSLLMQLNKKRMRNRSNLDEKEMFSDSGSSVLNGEPDERQAKIQKSVKIQQKNFQESQGSSTRSGSSRYGIQQMSQVLYKNKRGGILRLLDCYLFGISAGFILTILLGYLQLQRENANEQVLFPQLQRGAQLLYE